MRHYVLGKHGWSAAGLCVLLPLCVGDPAYAAQNNSQGQIAIGSPTPGSLVAGRISLSLAYNTGFNRISAFTVFVDDQIHSSRDFVGMSNRGIQYLDLDTRSLKDGNHTIKVVAKGTRGMISFDEVNITVRNGVAGGADTVPPLVQFRNLTEGSVVKGKVTIDILAEDNTTTDLLVSIFVNQFPRLIKSSPPYSLDLNTSEFLDPMTGLGKVTIEAWAYDKNNNLGKARPITLKVEPEGPSENQTKAPAGALTRSMAMDSMEPLGPTPLRAQMMDPLVVPGMRGEMPPGRVDPRLPLSASAGMTGKVAAPRASITPGTRPSQPLMARATYPAVDPEFAPVGSASRGNLASGKVAVPYLRPRTGFEASENRVGSLGVGLAATMDPGGKAAGVRDTAPSQRPPSARPVATAHVAGAPTAFKSAPVATAPASAGPRTTVPSSARQVKPLVEVSPAPPTAEVKPKLTAAPVISVPLTAPKPAAPVAPAPVAVRPSAPPTRSGDVLGSRPAAKPAAVVPVKPAPVTPAVKPAPVAMASAAPVAKPVTPVVAKPVVVKPVAPIPVVKPVAPAAPAKPIIIASAAAEHLAPEVSPMPGGGAVLPIPGANPRQSPDALRPVTPAATRPTPPPAPVKPAPAPVAKPVAPQPVLMAKAVPAKPIAPIFVVVDKNAKPKADGTLPVEVFRLNGKMRTPTDRSYQIKRGDTLEAVAKRHGVTAKSLLVANGLSGGRALRSGSVIKVPGTFDLVLNDRRVAFDVTPRIENGLPIAPFRQIFEHAGGVVVWNPESQEVRAANDGKDVKLKIGSREAAVNQVVVVMDRAAFLDSGRTIVPVSFMEKALDLKAEYDVKNGTIMLVRK